MFEARYVCNDEIILGLTCKRLYEIHACHWSQPLRSFTTKRFFIIIAMVETYDWDLDEMELVHWKIRNVMLSLLRCWPQHVSRRSRQQEEDKNGLEICVGYECYGRLDQRRRYCGCDR